MATDHPTIATTRGIGTVAASPEPAPTRTVLLASPRSLCAGVERAMEIVERALVLYGAPVYVRKQIVHNAHVVADLEARGVVFVDELDHSAGVMAVPCLDAAQELTQLGHGVTVADPRWIIPVNPFLTHLATRHKIVVTAEDSSRTGGMGSLIQTACADHRVTTPIRALGLPRRFQPHGERAALLSAAGLDGPGITRTTLAALAAMPADLEEQPDGR